MERTVLDALHVLLFLLFVDIDRFRTRVNVDRLGSMECGFRHEENDENKHKDEGATHCVHSDAVRAVLDDGSR